MKKEKLAKEVEVVEEKAISEVEPSSFLDAYKKQNPAKYEAKKARGEFKGL